MGTAIALSAIFIKPNAWFPVFLVVSLALIVVLPEDRAVVLPPLRRPRDRAGDQARLRLPVRAHGAGRRGEGPRRPAGVRPRPGDGQHYQQHRQEQERLRVVAFAFLTPFFFLQGGLNVSLGAVFANLGLLRCSLRRRWSPRWRSSFRSPAAHVPEHATFTTLLMSTGLTFGTISSLYGLHGRDHRRDAVLAPGHGRGALGDRADRDRAAVVPSGRSGRT